jgi:hypothetical protein
MGQKGGYMDNQQERLLREELSWATGIIEGEGHIGLSRHTVGYLQYVPRVQIINSDEIMLEEVGRILKKAGLAYYRKRRNIDPRVKRKPMHDLVIVGLKRVKRTLDVIMPYIRGLKIREAKIVLAFCNERLSQVNKFRPYTEKEHNLFKDYCRLRESPETIRPTQ